MALRTYGAVVRDRSTQGGSRYRAGSHPRGTLHSVPGPARYLVMLATPGFDGYCRGMAALWAGSAGPLDPDVVRGLQRKYRMNTGGAVGRLE